MRIVVMPGDDIGPEITAVTMTMLEAVDGDGTTSLFELDVKLDARDTPVIAPVMRERDPAE